jgi:hypothetical protein
MIERVILCCLVGGVQACLVGLALLSTAAQVGANEVAAVGLTWIGLAALEWPRRRAAVSPALFPSRRVAILTLIPLSAFVALAGCCAWRVDAALELVAPRTITSRYVDGAGLEHEVRCAGEPGENRAAQLARLEALVALMLRAFPRE